jgi:hypothetical protein
MELADQFGRLPRYAIGRHCGLQVIEERSAGLAAFRCVRAMHTVCKLRGGDRTKSRLSIADSRCDVLEEACCVEVLSLRFNYRTWIEYYSQSGGFHGLLRSAIPLPTSFMKPSSGIAVVPRASPRAMHSDNKRPVEGAGRMNGHSTMILLHDHFDAFLNLLQHGVDIASEFGFSTADGRHLFDHNVSSRSSRPLAA